jgi:ABC-type antimicrobial peptide transport system permease subunit
MALGATARVVVLHVIGDASKLVMVGLGAGLLAAAIVARLMASLVFGVSVADVVTFVGAPTALLAVALMASAVPAARAARVSPVIALGEE